MDRWFVVVCFGMGEFESIGLVRLSKQLAVAAYTCLSVFLCHMAKNAKTAVTTMLGGLVVAHEAVPSRGNLSRLILSVYIVSYHSSSRRKWVYHVTTTSTTVAEALRLNGDGRMDGGHYYCRPSVLPSVSGYTFNNHRLGPSTTTTALYTLCSPNSHFFYYRIAHLTELAQLCRTIQETRTHDPRPTTQTRTHGAADHRRQMHSHTTAISQIFK